MEHRSKNRLTFYFSKDHRTSMRLYFDSIESLSIFLNYMRRCASLEYLDHEIESYRGIWTLTDKNEQVISRDILDRKAACAPYKVHISIERNRFHDEFEFDAFFFAPTDADIFSWLINTGARQLTDVTVKAFTRVSPREEWLDYELKEFAPSAIASICRELDSDAVQSALVYMKSLKPIE